MTIADESQTEVTGEQLLAMLKRAELVAADRLVILRSMEAFFNAVNGARGQLLRDIEEINNAIAQRDTPDQAPDITPEEESEEDE